MATAPLFTQQRNASIEPLQGERKHARAERAEQDLGRPRIPPGSLRLGVEPDGMAVAVDESLDPNWAWLFVAVFDAASGLQQLIGTHRCIADKDQAPVGPVPV